MNKVQLQFNEGGRGAFFITENGIRLGEMDISISPGHLTAYHTEVAPEAEGRGLAKEMLLAMTTYAREKGLKVNPLCPYVLTQFKRHPEAYADLWQPPHLKA